MKTAKPENFYVKYSDGTSRWYKCGDKYPVNSDFESIKEELAKQEGFKDTMKGTMANRYIRTLMSSSGLMPNERITKYICSTIAFIIFLFFVCWMSVVLFAINNPSIVWR
jgi:hypothetical protein